MSYIDNLDPRKEIDITQVPVGEMYYLDLVCYNCGAHTMVGVPKGMPVVRFTPPERFAAGNRPIGGNSSAFIRGADDSDDGSLWIQLLECEACRCPQLQ